MPSNKNIITSDKDEKYESKNEEDKDKASLNYIDVEYRLNPDGSESRQIFGESELYQSVSKLDGISHHNVNSKNFHSKNIYEREESVVYAIIKPEIPPPTDLYLDEPISPKDKRIEQSSEIINDIKKHQQKQNDIDSKITSGIELPSPLSTSSSSSLVSNQQQQQQQYGDDDEFENIELPALPKRPPPLSEASPLDIQDVEYADASGDEDDGREDSLPDAMTADEAERLLSSR